MLLIRKQLDGGLRVFGTGFQTSENNMEFPRSMTLHISTKLFLSDKESERTEDICPAISAATLRQIALPVRCKIVTGRAETE